MNSFLNIEDGNLKLFSKTKFAIGNQLFLFVPKIFFLFFFLRSQHHRGLHVRTLPALLTLQTDFMEEDVSNLDRILWICSPITLWASSLSLFSLRLLFVSLLLRGPPLQVLWSDQASVVSRMKFLKL